MSTPQELLRAQRSAGKEWFNSLSPVDKWEVADQFVLGSFDWKDWADRFAWSCKPHWAFLRGADDERIYWEIMSNSLSAQVSST